MAFVEHHQRIRRQVVEQRRRRLAGPASRQIPRIVFDALAVADLLNHLQIKLRALLDALCLDQLADLLKMLDARLQLHAYRLDHAQRAFTRRHVVAFGEDGQPWHLALHFAGERIEEAQLLDLVVEQFDPHGFVIGFGRVNVDDLAPHPVSAAFQRHLVAAVLHGGELLDQIALRQPLALDQVQHHLEVGIGIPQAVNGRHAGDDDRVLAGDQRLGGRQPHLLDVLVDRRIFLDVRVGRRHVSLGLVVVVVADEILHRVVWKKFLELAIKLPGQGFVGRHDQRWPLHLGNDIGDGEGLARAGDAQQGLVRQPVVEPLHQLRDRGGLVAGRAPVRLEVKRLFGALIQANDF